jgi:hypothetical protein
MIRVVFLAAVVFLFPVLLLDGRRFYFYAYWIYIAVDVTALIYYSSTSLVSVDQSTATLPAFPEEVLWIHLGTELSALTIYLEDIWCQAFYSTIYN